MLAQGIGAIVNCSSSGGLIGIADRGVCHASKHGGIGLTMSAAPEYAARGIRFNAMCPGVLDSPIVEQMIGRGPDAMQALLNGVLINRRGRPKGIAAVVLWLCSPATYSSTRPSPSMAATPFAGGGASSRGSAVSLG